MEMNWYALRVQSNREFGIRDELRRSGVEGLEVYSPEWRKPHVYRGKQAVLLRALMPGYLFVSLPAASFLAASSVIMGIRGISGWLCRAGNGEEFQEPVTLTSIDVDRIRTVEADVNRERKVLSGDLVSIVDGWREGKTARVLRVDKTAKFVMLQEIDPATGRDCAVRQYVERLAFVVPLVSPAQNRVRSGAAALKRAA
jgi:transcription antitermination factor NusG